MLVTPMPGLPFTVLPYCVETPSTVMLMIRPPSFKATYLLFSIVISGSSIAMSAKRINATWIVMNDSRLGIIYDLQKGLFGGRISGTTFTNPNLVGFAESLGISASTISKPGELSQALRSTIAIDRSFLFDVRFDADEIPAVRPRSLMITKGMGLPNPVPGPEMTRALIKLLKDR